MNHFVFQLTKKIPFFSIHSRAHDSDVQLSEDEKNRLRTEQICRDVNRIVMQNLYSTAPHLVEAEVDNAPRHEAFWMVGGELSLNFWLTKLGFGYQSKC